MAEPIAEKNKESVMNALEYILYFVDGTGWSMLFIVVCIQYNYCVYSELLSHNK